MVWFHVSETLLLCAKLRHLGYGCTSGAVMNIEELSVFSEDELRSRANACLKDYDVASAMTRQHLIVESQFYLAEIERRKQAQDRSESERIANRDYKLELWVIGLIGAELLLAFAGIVIGWIEGSKQVDVLDNLNKSGAATAATLTAVRQAQEASLETQKRTLESIVAMNSALQDEMDLNFTEALQYSGGMSGSGQERIDFSNNGRATLFFWGSRFDGQSPRMQQKPTVLAPGSNKVSFDISSLITHLVETRKTPTVTLIPFELYFTRENGTKYVSKGNLQLNANNSVWIDRMTSTRKQW
jgi:hypothetical protein